jgi:hypothetical protein
MRPTLEDLLAAVSEARGHLETSLPDLARSARPVAIGWATVETERAERELADAFGAELAAFVDAPNDLILGARCRTSPLRPVGILTILEPATEGRLAETLARLGEGPAIVWFALAASHGDRSATPSPGPFGPEWLVGRRVRDGRHVLLVEDGPGTIAP